MGRTSRSRSRRKRSSRCYNLGRDSQFIDFMRWLVANGWSANCDLVPSVFPESGRGLMARRPIRSGDTIVKIPAQLLITIRTVHRSEIGRFFQGDKAFGTQQVLAAFLVWEKHLGRDSFWNSYISLLPDDFSSPLFCAQGQLASFPAFIKNKVDLMNQKLESLYDDLLKALSPKVCRHCDRPYTDIFTRFEFMWAWFTVNSRAVYMSPSHNAGHTIKLYDNNCLALAPYLDLLNHSDDAKVQAYLVEDEGSYCLRTLVSYEKYKEVFIHYGSHSNIKLYLEYGFILPQNKNDVVMLDLTDILAAISAVFKCNAQCSSVKYKMLQSHDMLTSLYCNCEGLSWNLKVVIYVIICPDTTEMKLMYRKIFSDGFSPREMNDIMLVGKELVNKKHACITEQLHSMEAVLNVQSDKILLLGVELLKILCTVLDKCKISLENFIFI